MPFVQRDRSGKVTGVFSNPQPQPNGVVIGAEEVADDNPDLLAYLKLHPPPKPRRTTEAQRVAADKRTAEIDAEARELQSLVTSFTHEFANLETALSALMNVVINKPGSRIGYAMYFAPEGFHARLGIMDHAIRQTAFEVERRFRGQFKTVIALWGNLKAHMQQTSQKTRNVSAHGIVQILTVRGNPRVVLLSPAFDVNRVGREVERGGVPGLEIKQLREAIALCQQNAEFVDELNRIFTALNEGDGATLLETLARLENGLTTALAR